MTTTNSKPRIAWHYTTGLRLAQILESKRLNLETGIMVNGSRRSVWFTTADQFERTALGAWKNPNGTVYNFKTPAEMAENTDGLVRIGIDPKRLKSYAYWVENSKTSEQMIDALETIALHAGSNPKADWLVSFKPIQQSAWLAIETSKDDEVWTPWDGFEQLGGRGF